MVRGESPQEKTRMAQIEYQVVAADAVDVGELQEFYHRHCGASTDSPEKLARMVAHSLCFVTARHGGELIGVARGVTDGLNGYIADCKLDPAYQGPAAVTRRDGRIEDDEQGIAREMLQRVIDSLRGYGVERIHAWAYGTEIDFCEAVGFKKGGVLTAMHLDTAVIATA
jgi:hypothetical protein